MRFWLILSANRACNLGLQMPSLPFVRPTPLRVGVLLTPLLPLFRPQLRSASIAVLFGFSPLKLHRPCSFRSRAQSA